MAYLRSSFVSACEAAALAGKRSADYLGRAVALAVDDEDDGAAFGLIDAFNDSLTFAERLDVLSCLEASHRQPAADRLVHALSTLHLERWNALNLVGQRAAKAHLETVERLFAYPSGRANQLSRSPTTGSHQTRRRWGRREPSARASPAVLMHPHAEPRNATACRSQSRAGRACIVSGSIPRVSHHCR